MQQVKEEEKLKIKKLIFNQVRFRGSSFGLRSQKPKGVHTQKKTRQSQEAPATRSPGLRPAYGKL